MKLLLRRNQKSGMLSAVTFTLDARAELAPEESANIKKYKLGKTMLYQKMEWRSVARAYLASLQRLAFKMMNITVTIDELVDGKHIECKDIVEMRAVEEQIKEACQNFKMVLEHRCPIRWRRGIANVDPAPEMIDALLEGVFKGIFGLIRFIFSLFFSGSSVGRGVRNPFILGNRARKRRDAAPVRPGQTRIQQFRIRDRRRG